MKLPAFMEEIRLLGLKGAIFRTGYEILNRTGLTALREPVVSRRPEPWRHRMDGAQEASHDLVRAWRAQRPPFLLAPDSLDERGQVLRRLLAESQVHDLLHEAEQAIRGTIRGFSRVVLDYGNPVDWHRNPRRGASWPHDVHYSRVLQAEQTCGDVKLTWEINRFPHLYTWWRAYTITGDARWVRAFCTQLASWEHANPYRAGVNWHSGQELAIRALSWLFALYCMGDDSELTAEHFGRLMTSLSLHAEHIDAHIDYARLAVHNNHLIGEALGLYLIGSLFPWFPSSARWKRTGRTLLEQDCLRQFYNDGGYCQSSHTYHRLALDYYLCACRAAEVLNEPFPQRVYDIIEQSGAYLASFFNESDGRLPNWGANDGARLFPWTSCDSVDFRPTLTAIRYLTAGKRAFDTGPWDEQLLWLWGPDALRAEVDPYPTESRSFPVAGLHVLREGSGDFVVLRCGSVIDRFGQADQLHVDLWWRGLNVTQDGGSYLYNDELAFHRYFMGTASHNTVTVDGQDQMRLHRRFKWLYWTVARCITFNPRMPGVKVVGEHDGYLRLRAGVRHRRQVLLLGRGMYLVLDSLLPLKRSRHRYGLHWLLGDWPWIPRQIAPFVGGTLQTPQGDYDISIGAILAGNSWAADANFSVERTQDGVRPRGWVSRYYSEKQPALSVSLEYQTDWPLALLTVFCPSDQRPDVSFHGDEGLVRIHHDGAHLELDPLEGLGDEALTLSSVRIH